MPAVAFDTAQAVLATLIGQRESQPLFEGDCQVLAQWLIKHDLAPLAYHTYGRSWPALAQHLQSDYFAAVAESSMLFNLLDRVLTVLNGAEIPTVILKGAAVSTYAYPKPELRMMSDIDIWVGPQHIQETAVQLEKAGLINKTKKGTFAQYGKIDLYAPEWVRGAIDLHSHMFAGYWLTTTTLITDEALLAHTQPLTIKENGTNRLCPEDALIHAALHVCINHKFDETSLRTLTDVAFLIQKNIDWQQLLAKVTTWRIQNAVSFVLLFVAKLFQIETVYQHWPADWLNNSRQQLLSRFVSPQTLLGGFDLSQSFRAYLFHMLLLDRALKDAGPLMWHKLRQQ